MKRLLPVLLMFVLLLSAFVPAMAEQAADDEAVTDEIPFGDLLISPDTEILDFDEKGIQVTDAKALAEVLDRLPNLKEVRMFDSPMAVDDM